MPAAKLNGDGQLLRAVVSTLSIIACIVGTTLWLAEALHKLDKRVAVMEQGIQNRWTSKDQEMWAQQLQSQNTSLIVPSVRAIVEWPQSRPNGSN